MGIGTETRQWRKDRKEYRCFTKSRKRKGLSKGGGVKVFKGMRDFREHRVSMAQETMVREARRVKSCAIPGCEGKHHAKGFCSRHYRQVKRNGKVNGD